MNRSGSRSWLAGALAVAMVGALSVGRFCLGHSLLAGSGTAQQRPVPSLFAAAASAPPPAPASTAATTDPTYALSPRSPVDTFRDLLAMHPTERKQALANRPPEVQRALLAKVREYESLNPTLRELRLKSTELYYYLWPLMNTPPATRQALLALVPERDRKEIQKRLKTWDAYPGGKQQELLTNVLALRFYGELKSGPPPLPPVSPAEQEKLNRGVRQWRALSTAQQQRLATRFDRFFELSPDEQQKAANTLSESERRQIEKTLRNFENLSADDRSKCILAFQRFASLSLEQRRQFLKNAEAWKLLSPEQRQNWCNLVNNLPVLPPEPPGLNPPPAPPDARFPGPRNLPPSSPPPPPGTDL